MAVATSCWLSSQSPPLGLIRALHWLRAQSLLPEVKGSQIHSDAQVHPTAVLEGGGTWAWLHHRPHVHVHVCVIMGRNGHVSDSTVIGHGGFG